MRRLILNIYDDIDNTTVGAVVNSGLPEQGIIVYTFHSGKKIVTAKRDYTKTDVYDIYKEKE